MGKTVHPDVKRFKAFVKNHPYVLKDIKKGDKTLQDLFEEYVLFGEEDDIWETYRDESDDTNINEDADEEDAEEDEEENDEKSTKSSINAKDIFEMVKKMNMNDLQKNLAQVSGVLASVQDLLLQFKQDESNRHSSMSSNETNDQQSPFSFRDD